MYFSPPKELNLPEPIISFEIKNEVKGIKINLSSDKLVKNLFLYLDEDVYFSKNYFDLIPGEIETAYCETSLKKEEFERKLKCIYLNKK